MFLCPPTQDVVGGRPLLTVGVGVLLLPCFVLLWFTLLHPLAIMVWMGLVYSVAAVSEPQQLSQ